MKNNKTEDDDGVCEIEFPQKILHTGIAIFKLEDLPRAEIEIVFDESEIEEDETYEN
jgi:hypothetical protein